MRGGAVGAVAEQDDLAETGAPRRRVLADQREHARGVVELGKLAVQPQQRERAVVVGRIEAERLLERGDGATLVAGLDPEKRDPAQRDRIGGCKGGEFLRGDEGGSVAADVRDSSENGAVGLARRGVTRGGANL